jgi:hypothetical protein
MIGNNHRRPGFFAGQPGNGVVADVVAGAISRTGSVTAFSQKVENDAVGQSQSLLGEVLRHRPYLWTRRCPIAAIVLLVAM